MSIEIKRSDKYVDYNISAANNRGYITIDTSDWINKPWMFYELPALKFEIYTETEGELVKYQNFTREIRTYNPVYSPLGVLNVTIDIRNVPEEFILRITPIFDNDAIVARNMLIENGIEDGDIWGSDQDVPTQLFNLDLEFIECSGEYVPPTHEETITGVPPITFDGSTGEPLVSWTILGNSSQSGTPTPDNPVMPEFVGVRTANLFKGAFGSSIGTTGGIAYSDQYEVYYARVTAGATYTISGGYYVYAYYSKIPSVGTANSVDNERHFTSQGNVVTVIEGATWIGVRVNSGDKPMINLGSTALPYEPFGWAEKITCAGQTVPVYLGQTQTVRRVKKLVFDGTENWQSATVTGGLAFLHYPTSATKDTDSANVLSTHYKPQYRNNDGNVYITNHRIVIVDFSFDSVDSFKSYLAAQYAAGHPVTVWYVLANEQTGIVNEPLCKIGDYADELHSTDAAVTIPTAKGQNTLTVDTPIQPSEMTITYIKEGQ